LYFQKRHLMIRGGEKSRRVEVEPHRLIAEIARQFGIEPDVVARALSILKRQGDLHGPAVGA
jgi:hypothetical protein